MTDVLKNHRSDYTISSHSEFRDEIFAQQGSFYMIDVSDQNNVSRKQEYVIFT